MNDQQQTSEAIFNSLPEYFQGDNARGMKATYQFDITGDNGGKWFIEINDGACKVEKGTHPNPMVTFTIAGADHVALFSGKLNPQMAFMSGKLKLKGDITLALKFNQLFKRQ